MKVSKHLDWLSITLANGLKWKNLLYPLPFVLSGKGRHGYRALYRHEMSGITVETDAFDEHMGTHFTIGGDGLNFLRDNLGWTDDDTVRKLQEWGAKCSRIDLAIDCRLAAFTPDMLNEAIMDGSARLPARTWRYIDGHKNGIRGSTVDTGSTSSDRRFRFYDKAAEQGIKDGEAWVRLELQLRRLYATSTVVSCGQYGTEPTIGRAIGNYLTWENTEYLAALTGDCAVIPTIPRPTSKRRKWLLGQVAQSLAMELHRDPAFVDKFWRSVGQFLDNLTDKGHNDG